MSEFRYRAFEKICKMTQIELKKYLANTYNMISGDGYLYKEGTFPVLLTAHMDTVHKVQCRKVRYKKDKDQTILSSPVGIGGDDRCGIFMALKIAQEIDCSILFCEDEEVGSIGADKFVKTDLCESLKGKFRYIIELDRANSKDAVFYEDDNDEFHEFVTKEFWKETWGSWSDICTLSPALEISSVNFSCGYYKAHTTNEYVVFEEMEKSIEEVIKLLNRTDKEKTFEFKRKVIQRGAFSGLYNWYGYDDYWDSSLYSSLKTYTNRKKTNNDIVTTNDTEIIDEIVNLEVVLNDETCPYLNSQGYTLDEAWKNLFMDNDWLCFADIIDWYTY